MYRIYWFLIIFQIWWGEATNDSPGKQEREGGRTWGSGKDAALVRSPCLSFLLWAMRMGFISKFFWGSDILTLKTPGNGNMSLHFTYSYVFTKISLSLAHTYQNPSQSLFSLQKIFYSNLHKMIINFISSLHLNLNPSLSLHSKMISWKPLLPPTYPLIQYVCITHSTG